MSNLKGVNRSESEKQILKQFGMNIRQLRQKKGYSQELFAHLAGFSRSYYTEIETGKRNPSLLNIVKIMQALEAEANTLLEFAEMVKHV